MHKANKVPVSINQVFYSEEDFVSQINKGYEAAVSDDTADLKALFRQYENRNYCPTWMKLLLNIKYDKISPAHSNGLNRWAEQFSENAEALAEMFDVDDYLQDVLVKDLNHFISDCSLSLEVSCSDYRDYIYQCIFYDYVPNLDIRWHKQRGWGLFAKQDIPPFTFIGLYVGNILPTAMLKFMEWFRGYHKKYVWLLSFNTFYGIDSEVKGNYTRFMNHDEENSKRITTFSLQMARDEKVWSIPNRGFIANMMSPEQPKYPFYEGEELVWNYGPRYIMSTTKNDSTETDTAK